MLNLSILLFIQFIFCMVFFFYFRKKIHETLKLKDYRHEIEELIISFNRQAERHITYLETLLDNDLVKKNLRNYEQEKNEIPQARADILPARHDSKANVQPSTLVPSEQKKPTEVTLPPQLIKSYYAQFSSVTDEESVNSEYLSPKNKYVKHSNKTINNHTNISPRRQLINSVLLLKQKRISTQSIAKRLAISTGEVQLILKLHTSENKSGGEL